MSYAMQKHGPANHREMRHAQTRLAAHQHNPHRHTQRHQTAHTDTPSDKNTTVPAPAPWHAGGFSQGETWRESDGDTRGHTQTPHTCQLTEAGCSGGRAWAPAACRPGASLSLVLTCSPSLRLSSPGNLWVCLYLCLLLSVSVSVSSSSLSASLLLFVCLHFSLWLSISLSLPLSASVSLLASQSSPPCPSLLFSISFSLPVTVSLPPRPSLRVSVFLSLSVLSRVSFPVCLCILLTLGLPLAVAVSPFLSLPPRLPWGLSLPPTLSLGCSCSCLPQFLSPVHWHSWGQPCLFPGPPAPLRGQGSEPQRPRPPERVRGRGQRPPAPAPAWLCPVQAPVGSDTEGETPSETLASPDTKCSHLVRPEGRGRERVRQTG